MSEYDDQNKPTVEEVAAMESERMRRESLVNGEEPLSEEASSRLRREAARQANEAREIGQQIVDTESRVAGDVDQLVEDFSRELSPAQQDELAKRAQAASQQLEDVSSDVLRAEQLGSDAAQAIIDLPPPPTFETRPPQEEVERERALEQLMESITKASEFGSDGDDDARKRREEWIIQRTRRLLHHGGSVDFAMDIREKLSEQSQEDMLDRIVGDMVERGEIREAGFLTSEKVHDPQRRDRWLADIAIESQSMDASLDIIRTIMDPKERDRAIHEVIPNLEDKSKALRIAGSIQDEVLRRRTIDRINGASSDETLDSLSDTGFDRPPRRSTSEDEEAIAPSPDKDNKEKGLRAETSEATEDQDDVYDRVKKIEEAFRDRFTEFFREMADEVLVAIRPKASREKKMIGIEADRSKRLAENLRERLAEQKLERDRAKELLELDEARIRIIRGKKQIEELKKARTSSDETTGLGVVIAKLESDLEADKKIVEKTSTFRLAGGLKKGLREAGHIVAGTLKQVFRRDESIGSGLEEASARLDEETVFADSLEERLKEIEGQETIHRNDLSILAFENQLAQLRKAKQISESSRTAARTEEQKNRADQNLRDIIENIERITMEISRLEDASDRIEDEMIKPHDRRIAPLEEQREQLRGEVYQLWAEYWKKETTDVRKEQIQTQIEELLDRDQKIWIMIIRLGSRKPDIQRRKEPS